MQDDPKCSGLAIIGGGRWARVMAKLVCGLGRHPEKLLLCSPGNPQAWKDWLENVQPFERELPAATATLEEVFSDNSVTHVIIARRASQHAVTALEAIRAGKHVMIEKPFALNLREAWLLLGNASGKTAITGLVFLFAANVTAFACALRETGKIKLLEIDWADPPGEHRHGAVKTYDPGLNVVQDVFPHVWSILVRMLGKPYFQLDKVAAEEGGRAVKLNLRASDCSIAANLTRDSDERVRRIVARGDWGEAYLDFSKEPGRAAINGVPVDVATGFTSPLGLEIETFLRNEFDDPVIGNCRIENAVSAIELTDAMMPEIRKRQFFAIQEGLAIDAGRQQITAGNYALREIVAGAIAACDPELPLDENYEMARLWLTGKAADEAILPCIRDEAGLSALRNRLP